MRLSKQFLQDVTMVPPYWLSMIFFLKLPGYSDVMGFIVDCEACDQVVMQYDRCDNIMAFMQSCAEWQILSESKAVDTVSIR